MWWYLYSIYKGRQLFTFRFVFILILLFDITHMTVHYTLTWLTTAFLLIDVRVTFPCFLEQAHALIELYSSGWPWSCLWYFSIIPSAAAPKKAPVPPPPKPKPVRQVAPEQPPPQVAKAPVPPPVSPKPKRKAEKPWTPETSYVAQVIKEQDKRFAALCCHRHLLCLLPMTFA